MGVIHKDHNDKVLSKGDKVVFIDTKSSRFVNGTILSLGKSRVTIGYENRKGIYDMTTRFPDKVIKM